MAKWVYGFGGGKADGSASMRMLLGGKGANLAEMSALGLPVPPGFTITTEVCTYYYANDRQYPPELAAEVDAALAKIESELGMRFGDPLHPLLCSVRSGAPLSMPGMMNTVLNLGLNDRTVEGLAAAADDERFAFDSYRRFIQMYGDVVLGVDHYLFEEALEEAKAEAGVRLDNELDALALKKLVETYKGIVKNETGHAFPEDPKEQLWGAVGAVFGSWHVPRAVTYRRLHDISSEMGTAVNVQAMVFGNMGSDCATGVAFTRNPSTGERAYYGEFLVNAQGEDVVAGIRTPQPLSRAMAESGGSDPNLALETVMPQSYRELADVFEKLEQHYREMQDIEFTVQQRKLYILQTRTGKRTAPAALKIAVDMAAEGLITEDEAILRVDPSSLEQLLHPTLDPDHQAEVLAHGLPASPGAASGKIVFLADDALSATQAGDDVILVRVETSPDDIHGMHAAKGILTSRGGMTSHAAVVARGMGKACICGVGELLISYPDKTVTVQGRVLKEGDWITIDGAAGVVMLGKVPTVDPVLSGDFATLMGWADKKRRLKVRTNAETPLDANTAIGFGAEGIGLCRTEHMFFQDERILAMREMILSEDVDGRRKALAKIAPYQRDDFVELFEIMRGLPVTIRLLDPPLHEFLPHSGAEDEAGAAAAGGLGPGPPPPGPGPPRRGAQGDEEGHRDRRAVLHRDRAGGDGRADRPGPPASPRARPDRRLRRAHGAAHLHRRERPGDGGRAPGGDRGPGRGQLAQVDEQRGGRAQEGRAIARARRCRAADRGGWPGGGGEGRGFPEAVAQASHQGDRGGVGRGAGARRDPLRQGWPPAERARQSLGAMGARYVRGARRDRPDDAGRDAAELRPPGAHGNDGNPGKGPPVRRSRAGAKRKGRVVSAAPSSWSFDTSSKARQPCIRNSSQRQMSSASTPPIASPRSAAPARPAGRWSSVTPATARPGRPSNGRSSTTQQSCASRLRRPRTG